MAKTKLQFSPDLLKKVEALLLAEKTKLEKELAKFSKKKSGKIFARRQSIFRPIKKRRIRHLQILPQTH